MAIVTSRPGFSVRELAVIDLHGAHGRLLRRRLVLLEFVLCVAVGAPLGGCLIEHGGMAGWISGVWLLGIALNYVPLLGYAVALSPPGRLRAAVRQIGGYPATARYYSVAQWRLIVPFLLVVLARSDGPGRRG